MIIKQVYIKNYGLFKGEHAIELLPQAELHKNITLISGQNGVGKSTILEAIHIGLLGSLAIDSRLSEANYESFLYKKAHRSQLTTIQETSVGVDFEFIKSGVPIHYRVLRTWMHDRNDVGEQVWVWENEKELIELNKKEKNLFLRELIQPGFAKVIFFDGERLSSLFEGNNLTLFLAESCRYLFGLNFIDQLKTDLSYFAIKQQGQKQKDGTIAEINKTIGILNAIEAELQKLRAEAEGLNGQLQEVQQQIHTTESEISAQGRWATQKLDKIKIERQKLELSQQTLRKELIDLLNTLGPLLFCRNQAQSLRNRLLTEREIEKWQHTKEILNDKLKTLKEFLNETEYLKGGKNENQSKSELFKHLKNILLAPPVEAICNDKIYHQITDNDRTKIITWIEAAFTHVSVQLKEKAAQLTDSEELLRLLAKEQQTFSKEDAIQPLLKTLQELNKKSGSIEQRLESVNRQLQEQQKRQGFYQAQRQQLQDALVTDESVDAKLKLAEKTKSALEEYGQRLIGKKLELLQTSVLQKFNLLCRKQNYFDRITIDANAFSIQLSRQDIVTDHLQLSAGEKQLLILSILWGLRELTNISLPLIIDTPLARLDAHHRKSFLNVFLPAMQPQVILIGTDMEVLSDVLDELDPHIARHYLLKYDGATQANKINEASKLLEGMAV